MSEPQVFPVPEDWKAKTRVNAAAYAAMRAEAKADPAGFFGEAAKARLQWMRPFTTVKDTSFALEDFRIRWFADGVLNVSANCIDRHLPERANDVAIIWEGDGPDQSKQITYAELHRAVCRMANVLKRHGVAKGDRVTIYLPMIPEAAYAMLACARIGAIHSVVFGGFSPDSLSGRINDCASTLVITADEGLRGGKKVPLKANVDEALKSAPGVETVLVVTRTGAGVPMQSGRDFVYEREAAAALDECEPEPMGAEDPLFILYT